MSEQLAKACKEDSAKIQAERRAAIYTIYTPSLLLLMGIVCISEIGLGFISPLRALYGHGLGATSITLGFMASSFFLAGFLTLPLIGWLADHFGHRRILWIGLLAHTLLVLAYIPVDHPVLLIGIHLLEGIAAASVLPPARAMINLLAPKTRQAEAVSTLTAATYVGYLLGPLVGTILASQVGYTWSFLLASLPLALSVMAVLFLPSPPRQHKSTLVPHPATSAIQAARAAFSFSGIVTRSLLLAYILVFIADATQYINTAIWVLYLQDSGASLVQIGLSFTIFGVIIIIGSPLAGRFSDRHGRYWQLVVGFLLIGLTFWAYSLRLSPWFLVLCSGGEGIATIILSSALDGFLADNTPDGVKGQVQGQFRAAGTLGGFIGASGAGLLYASAQSLPFAIGGGICLTMFCLLTLPALRRLFPAQSLPQETHNH